MAKTNTRAIKTHGFETDKEYIYYMLMNSLNNPYAASAVMGWLYYISRFNTSFIGILNIDQFAYTKCVDNGNIRMEEFRKDGVAYGIAGWTDWIEKQGLWCTARRNAASISDLRSQMQLLVSTFSESRHEDAVMKLMNIDSLLDAVKIVVKDYDKSSKDIENTVHSVYIFAKDFYDELGDSIEIHEDATGRSKWYVHINKRTVIRSRANILGSKVGVAKPGDSFPLYQERPDDPQSRWVTIEYAWGVGYIPRKYVEIRLSDEGECHEQAVD